MTDGDLRGGVFVPFPTITVPAPTSRYRYLAEDIPSRTLLGELPLSKVDATDSLNRPGALRGAMPADHPKAGWLDEGRTAIYMERDRQIIWGGPLWRVDRGLGSRELQVSCGGWSGYFDHRQIWQAHTFTGVDQFSIFKALVDDAQDEAALGAGADLGITVVWDALSGVLRDRGEYVPHKAKNLGEALRQLAATDDGFDFSVELQADPATDSIIKRIRLHHPHQGRDTQFLFQFEGGRATDVQEAVTIGGEPVTIGGEMLTTAAGRASRQGLRSNITRWGLTRDAERMAWRVRGWGAGLDDDRASSVQIDETLRDVYPFLDADLTDFTSVETQATLDANTVAAALRLGHSQRLPIVEVDPDMHPQFGAWALGDTIRLRINDGYGSIAPRVEDVPPSVRIIGWSLSPASDRFTLALQEAA